MDVIIHRRNGESAALIATDKLVGLLETAHLLNSSVNAQRLLNFLTRALKGEGVAMTVNELRDEVVLGE